MIMINKIDNSCSFKANIETAIKVSDKKRLKNIQNMFKQATKKYPQEKLYLTEKENGQISLHTSTNSANPIHEEISTNNLQEFFNKLSDEEITRKFTNAFKVLRLSDISDVLKKTIEYNEIKLKNNKRIANNLRKIGRDDFADKYDLFAKFNNEKIESLTKERNKIRNDFIKQQKNASKEFPEVLQIEI